MELGPLQNALKLLFPVATMLGLGLAMPRGALAGQWAERGLFLRALLVNFVLVPLLGLLLVRLIPVGPDVKVALLLLAVSAGGIGGIQFTRSVASTASFATVLLFVLCLLSIFVAPALAGLVLPGGLTAALSPARLLVPLFLYLLLPLLVGLQFRRLAPGPAAALAGPLSLVGALSFVAFGILIGSLKREAMASLQKPELLAMLILVLGAMLLGWLFGGPSPEHRRVLASGTGMRNVAVALWICGANFGASQVDVAIIACMALMIPVNALYTIGGKVGERLAKRRAKKRADTDRT